MTTACPKRMASVGWLLWEYSADDARYYLVGFVDCSVHSVNEDTGKSTDEEAADKFIETGTVECEL